MTWRPTYLRMLVWSCCTLRCPYCHREGQPAAQKGDGVPTDRLAFLAEASYRAGIRKFKLLGGEALLRPDLPRLVMGIRKVAPDADISLITAGALPPHRLEAAIHAGLDRVNLTVHGWTTGAFGERGGTRRMLTWREACLDVLAVWGRPTKLNFVHRGPEDDGELAALLGWIRQGRTGQFQVGVLDDLTDPVASAWTAMQSVRRVAGAWSRVVPDADPHSLPSSRLHFEDGLVVELKTSRLGERAPWRACEACPHRPRCREGTLAVRLNHHGAFHACMDRPDLAFSLPSIQADDPAGAAALLGAWFDEVAA